jgi:dockerin type I repeat protein
MKTKNSSLKTLLSSAVIIALFFTSLATVPASAQDRSRTSANSADVSAAAVEASLAAAKEKAAIEAAARVAPARVAPERVTPVMSRAVQPAVPNGVNPIVVTATAGTLGPTQYPTLGAAFAAINAGTHQGDITVSVQGNSAEGATPATLNGNGVGPALYDSVVIRPTSDGFTISGSPASGFGVLQLNGSVNPCTITINGDAPGAGANDRNLTISNTAAAATTFCSAVRVATGTGALAANNVTVKNLILNGNVTGGNAAGITATTTSANNSFGIVVGPNGGSAGVTALTSVTAGMAASATANNFVADNNAINQAGRGVAFLGGTAASSTGITITNNTIGGGGALAGTPPYTSPSSTVYIKGIYVQGTNAYGISGNTIQNILSFVGIAIAGIEINSTTGSGTLSISNNSMTGVVQNATNAFSARGISMLQAGGPYSIAGNTIANVQNFTNSTTITNQPNGIFAATTAASATIETNKVTMVYDRNTNTDGVAGVFFNGGNNITFRNNFVSDINQDITGGVAFSTTFGTFGVRVSAGTGHKIYHNSINLFGPQFGTSNSSILSAALVIVSTTSTGMDVRNNILSNTLTGGTTSVAHVSIFLPSGGTSAMNLTDNNNDYFFGPDAARQGAGQAGTTAGTNFFTTLAALQAYSSTLSPAGTNDNASKALDPQFVSNTDLHIAVASPMVDMGVDVGVARDIDGQNRVPPPDIGADEPSGVTPPANDISATAIVTPANGSSLATGTVVSPQASFTNIGSATQTNVMVQFTITGPGGYNYTNTQSIATITPSQTITVTFAPAPAFAAAGTYNTTATVTTADSNGANDQIMGTFTALIPLAGGIYNVPGDFPSLTNNGGIFSALNAAGATGNITINIAADLTGETGANALNELAGGFSVLIRPVGGARTISGSSGPNALIDLNGADNVTIDGVIGASQDLVAVGGSLTIRNTNNAAAAVIRLINDASNNTIENCNIEGGTTSGNVLISTGTTTGNDNNIITNNIVRDRTDAAGVPFNEIINAGTSAAVANSNTVITNNQCLNFSQSGLLLFGGDENSTVMGNDISQTASRTTAMFSLGVQAAFGTNLISQNTVHDISASGAVTTRGIFLADARGTTVSRNSIYNFPSVAAATGDINGIEFDGGSGLPSSVTIANNMVSIVPAVSTNQRIRGLFDFGFTGNTFNAFYNSIYIGGTSSGTTASWALDRGIIAATTHTDKNNLCYNNRTGGGANHFADGDDSANTGTFVSDFNYFIGTGTTPANFFDYGTASSGTPVSFAAWKTGPPARDASSTATLASAVTPASFFLNANGGNLHLACGAPPLNLGTPIGGITTDFDGQTRGAPPDIGADEQFAPTPLSAVSSKVHGGAGTFSLNLPFVGAPGIEPRSTGGNHQIVFTFAGPVTVGSATITGTGVVNLVSGNGTNIITVDLTGVANAQYIVVTLNCVNDGVNAGDVPVTMGVLAGDVNASTTVNGTDVSAVKLQSGGATNGVNFRTDLNASGTINGTDISIAKLASGNGLPPSND